MQQMRETFAAMQAAMQAAGWTQTRHEQEEGREGMAWQGRAMLAADGSSIWGDTHGLQVEAHTITVWADYDDYVSWHVGVEHNYDEGEKTVLYTDNGLEEAVSKLLGVSVSFTEQGMQDDFYMSMEL